MTKPEATETSAGGLSAEAASAHPSPRLAKRSTPAGIAMATLELFKDNELDESQELKLVALRADVISAQRSMGTDLLARRDALQNGAGDAGDLEGLGSAMTETQRQIVDRTLAGALELWATLSPAQRLAFVGRARDSARSAHRLAAKLVAEGVDGGRSDDQVGLAQDRAKILDELAKTVPDQDKVRTLGSAFVVAHARANGATVSVPTRAISNP